MGGIFGSTSLDIVIGLIFVYLLLPRVNLAEVYAIALQNGATEVPVNLPYEMIIVAVLP